VPVVVTANAMLDTQGAADFTAARLQALQVLPCMNATTGSGGGTGAGSPAFCTEFAAPAVCGSGSYAYTADGSSIPQCEAAGASMLLNVLSPESCVAGTPPTQYALDVTGWLSEQLDFIGGTRWKGSVMQALQQDAAMKPKVGLGGGGGGFGGV
jgi:hypothetical protein